MDVLGGKKTIKTIIDKKYFKLSFGLFRKEVSKCKELYHLEKIFLQVIYQFRPSWDIEIEVFLLADTYELTNKDFFGALKRLNPLSDTVVTGIAFRELIIDGEFQFEPCSIRSITSLLRR